MTTTTERRPPRVRVGTGTARRGKPPFSDAPVPAAPGGGSRRRAGGPPLRDRRTRPAPPARLGVRTGPVGGAAEGTRTRPAQPASAARHGAPRTPFVFLVVGLLSGGLICLLLLNTVLAAGTFQITSLQQSNAGLVRQQQALEQQIANSQAPGTLAHRARQLGMIPVSQPLFVNLKSGRIAGRATAHGGGSAGPVSHRGSRGTSSMARRPTAPRHGTRH